VHGNLLIACAAFIIRYFANKWTKTRRNVDSITKQEYIRTRVSAVGVPSLAGSPLSAIWWATDNIPIPLARNPAHTVSSLEVFSSNIRQTLATLLSHQSVSCYTAALLIG